jgi:3'(2'), 5'-bisphosphate nucleotidase
MSSDPTSDDLLRAAERGAQTVLKLLPQARRAIEKGAGDFALQADLEAERAIIAELQGQFPSLPIVGEESWQDDSLPEDFICIDPLDGTIIASRGCPEWGVMLTFVKQRRPQACVVLQPQMNRCFTADHYGGCRVRRAAEDQNLHVLQAGTHNDESRNSERFVLALEMNFATTAEQIDRFIKPLAASGCILVSRTAGCAANGIAELALGISDASMNPAGGKVWDYAPAALIARELGGEAFLIDCAEPMIRPFLCEQTKMGVLLVRSPAVAAQLRRAICRC